MTYTAILNSNARMKTLVLIASKIEGKGPVSISP